MSLIWLTTSVLQLCEEALLGTPNFLSKTSLLQKKKQLSWEQSDLGQYCLLNRLPNISTNRREQNDKSRDWRENSYTELCLDLGNGTITTSAHKRLHCSTRALVVLVHIFIRSRI